MSDQTACIRTLRNSIAECSPHGLAKPMWVQEVIDIIELIEEQKAYIEALETRHVGYVVEWEKVKE